LRYIWNFEYKSQHFGADVEEKSINNRREREFKERVQEREISGEIVQHRERERELRREREFKRESSRERESSIERESSRV